MASYVPYYRKKLQALARKKLKLARLLERQGTERQVARSAEAVRESQISALRAKRAQIPPCEANAARLRSIDEDISSCLGPSIADIIAWCRRQRSSG
jgi:hypothetical protein